MTNKQIIERIGWVLETTNGVVATFTSDTIETIYCLMESGSREALANEFVSLGDLLEICDKNLQDYEVLTELYESTSGFLNQM